MYTRKTQQSFQIDPIQLSSLDKSAIKSELHNHIKHSHSKMIYQNLDKQFILSIQRQHNANEQYYNKMKSLQMDELDKGLYDYQKNKMNIEKQKQNIKKDYRERVNSVLGEIQKNIFNRSKLFMSQLNKQQEKKKIFIDDNLVKQRKISQHVDINYDQNLFLHQNDKYQQYQENQNNNTLIMREWQLNQQRKIKQLEKDKKKQQQINRLNYQKQLQQKRKIQQQNKIQQQIKYQEQLKKMVQDKIKQSRKASQSPVKIQRHNPITNPIEYHIQNPYILKKLEKFK